MTENKRYCRLDDFEHWNVVKDNVTTEIYDDAKDIADLLNELAEEKEILEVQLTWARTEIDKLGSEIDMLTTTCHDCCKEIREENKELKKKNEQLRNRIKDWHQRTFTAHEYFNILEKVIDEVCNDDISNQIWKEYEKREKLIA